MPEQGSYTGLPFKIRYAAGCSIQAHPIILLLDRTWSPSQSLAFAKLRALSQLPDFSGCLTSGPPLRHFDPLPGSRPLWRDVSVIPTSNTLSPLPGDRGFPSIYRILNVQPLLAAFANPSRDQKATSVRSNRRTDSILCRADFSAKQ